MLRHTAASVAPTERSEALSSPHRIRAFLSIRCTWTNRSNRWVRRSQVQSCPCPEGSRCWGGLLGAGEQQPLDHRPALALARNILDLFLSITIPRANGKLSERAGLPARGSHGGNGCDAQLNTLLPF